MDMRRRRCLQPAEIHFVTIRTVEERFALDPYACPNAWILAEGKQLDFGEKQAMRERGRACITNTQMLVAAVCSHEKHPTNVPRPVVPIADFTDSMPNIIGSVLARGVKMYGIHLYGFVAMSNHLHMLLSVPSGNLADFMAYVNGQIATNVNRFLGRKHQLWSRRYAAARVLDKKEEVKKLGYLLANPQNAGIADSIDEWPGLSSAPFLFQRREQRFVNFDRTAWYAKGRPQDIGPFLSTDVLKHELLPQLLNRQFKKVQRQMRRAIKAETKALPVVHANADFDPAARRTLLQRTVVPTERPEVSKKNPRKRSRQPLCHTTIPSLGRAYRQWYRLFNAAYNKSALEYRAGNIDVEFPTGSFAPSRYPVARYSSESCDRPILAPTRENLELGDALGSLFARFVASTSARRNRLVE